MVIVIESPNKVKKIAGFVEGAKVFATKGHFRDLPADELAIDCENNYELFISDIEGARTNIEYIKRACSNEEVILATDPDREGNAIAFMFFLEIQKIASSIKRAEFRSITEAEVQKGIKNAIPITQSNIHIDFEAWKARRAIDRLTGYALSPWAMAQLNQKGLSVGRVQSAALALIVERERELRDHKNKPDKEKFFYRVEAQININGIDVILKSQENFNIKDEAEEWMKLFETSKEALVNQKSVKTSEKTPEKPFSKGSLTAKAVEILNISGADIERAAQELFEHGLITYHRSDSHSIDESFINEMEQTLERLYPLEYKKRHYKAGDQSQAQAHEAVRITHIHDYGEIESLTIGVSDYAKSLYRLIWLNSVQSQMKNAEYEIIEGEFLVKGRVFLLSHKSIKKWGFLNLDIFDKNIEMVEPINFKEGDKFNIAKLNVVKAAKAAPARFNEASFIRELEKRQIGRPATIHTFLPLLQKREYIEIKESKKREIYALALGEQLFDLLFKNHPWVVEVENTKKMEDSLDEISRGRDTYVNVISELHRRIGFTPSSRQKQDEAPSAKQIELMEKIAKQIGKNPPPKAMESQKACREWLSKMMPTASKPSAKQIEYVKSIAATLGIKLSKEVLSSGKEASAFIMTHEKQYKMSKNMQGERSVK